MAMRTTALVIACFSFIAAAPQRAPSQDQSAELRLAVIAPISGNWASYGSEIMRGAELAVESLQNSSGPLKLIVEDACLPAEAVKAAQKLVSIDNIHAVVGSYCVIGMVPMTHIFEKHQIAAFHSTAVAEEVLSGNSFVFTTNVTIADEARELAAYAYKYHGPKAAMLWLRTQWGENYQRYFAEEFTKLGGKIVASFDPVIGVTDFRRGYHAYEPPIPIHFSLCISAWN